jgi:hypothetical protein
MYGGWVWVSFLFLGSFLVCSSECECECVALNLNVQYEGIVVITRVLRSFNFQLAED